MPKKPKKASSFIIILTILIFCSGNVYASQTSSATLSDQEYIEELGTLRVSVLPDRQPFVYYSQSKGQYMGFAIEALNRMSERTGLEIVYIPAESFTQSLEQLHNGQADVMAVIQKAPAGESALQTEAIVYLSSPNVLIFKKDVNPRNISQITTACIAGEEYLGTRGMPSVSFDTMSECFAAIRSGRADLMQCNMFTSELMLSQLYAQDLYAIPSTGELEIGFGISQDADERLRSLLIASVEMRSEHGIVGEYVDYMDQYIKTPTDYFYSYPFEVICFIGSVFFVILVLGVAYNRVKLRQNRAMNGYENSYRLLSDTFGEAGLEYDCINDKLILFGAKRAQFHMEEEIDDFCSRLDEAALPVALTRAQFEQMIEDGVSERAYQKDFQMGLKNGGWLWVRLIYTVICTEESHRKPIRLVGCLVNIEQERSEIEQLVELGMYDSLTGLMNRTAAEKAIVPLINNADLQKSGVLLLIDIDYFKLLNDNLGHLAGDAVLRFFGVAAREVFNKGDILCRWGGDEFVVFITDTDNAALRAEKQVNLLCDKMAGYQYKGAGNSVTISVGGTISRAGQTFEQMIEKADKALYRVKEQGRNGILIVTQESTETTEGSSADDA